MVHEQREAVQQEEGRAPEVVAFCTLIARIVLRCLQQHDTRLEQFLFLSTPSEEHYIGGTHDPTTVSKSSSQTSSALHQELPAQAAGRDKRSPGADRALHHLLP